MAADNETKKPYNEKKKEYNMKYQAEKLKRIPLDVQLDFYDEIKCRSFGMLIPTNY